MVVITPYLVVGTVRVRGMRTCTVLIMEEFLHTCTWYEVPRYEVYIVPRTMYAVVRVRIGSISLCTKVLLPRTSTRYEVGRTFAYAPRPRTHTHASHLASRKQEGLSGHHHSYYPGRRDELLLVSSPCLGAGPRTLLNDEKRSKRGLVRFSIIDGEIEDLEGWSGKSFDVLIDRDTLPKYVGSLEFPIWRDDLSEKEFVKLLQAINTAALPIP